ncbi:MAG: DUF2272 domain-containing protein [Gemmatimonadaceae bacterium]|nr:DUF2272 domain-containing protein [Acetobacteraceae bacterium]
MASRPCFRSLRPPNPYRDAGAPFSRTSAGPNDLIGRGMKVAALATALLLAACAAPPPAPAPSDDAVVQLRPVLPDQNVPDFAKRPFEPFARANAVGIAMREWRGFGSLVTDTGPDAPPVPRDIRPDRQAGLWQRVGEYWWLGQDAASRETGWTSKYDEFGRAYGGDAPAWSAAFVSYVMRSAGAGDRFRYSPLHADYINAAAQGLGAVRAERPDGYAPQPGDLICVQRGNVRALRYDDLPAPRFFAHCDLVVAAEPGRLAVVGGNVVAGVTMRNVPTTDAGMLAGPDGRLVDSRFNWFVVIRVLYDE